MHMRSLLLAALIGVVTVLRAAPVNAKTAGDLLISCEAVERGLVAQGDDSMRMPAEGATCWDYMEAVQDI
jgi:hypothetical protein